MSAHPESSPLPANPAASDPSWLDRLIELVLLGTLAFAAFAFGVVDAWSEQVVLSAVALLAACFLLKLIVDRSAQVFWSWSYLPVMLFLICAGTQSVALPAALLQRISPGTASLRGELLLDLPAPTRAPISFYPDATHHDVRLVLAAAIVFFVVVNTIRKPDQVKRLLGGIVIIGALVGLLALAQDATQTSLIYWAFPRPSGSSADGGPFVNHSHFAQFMNLAVGAAIALVMIRQRAALRSDVFRDHRLRMRQTDRIGWALIAMIVMSLLSVTLSMSRGGVLSTIVALGITVFLSAISRGQPAGRGAAILPVIAIFVFAIVLWVGFDSVYSRFAAAGTEGGLGGRGEILKDAPRLWRRFPLLGTGLGTFEVVYPLVDSSTFPLRTTHAENEYVQLMTETGVVGVVLAGAFLSVVGVAFVRCLRRQHLPVRASAYGLGFGLIAILVHSCSDFGQHLPANSLLSAVFFALLIGLGRSANLYRAKSSQPAVEKGNAPRWAGIGAAAVLAALLILAVPPANACSRAEARWACVTSTVEGLKASDAEGTSEQYEQILSDAAAAVDLQPENATYRYELNLYRWRSISRILDGEGRVLMTDAALAHTARIVDELKAGLSLCPTYGSFYSLIGQLETFVLNRPGGKEAIQIGYKLCPNDAAICMVAGQLAVREEDWDKSLRALRRAAKLDPSLQREIVDLYVNDAGRPMLAVEILDGDGQSLLSLADRLSLAAKENSSDGLMSQAAEEARRRAVTLLQAEADRRDASPQTLATMAKVLSDRKEYPASIAYYRRALAGAYLQTDWRLALAQTLEASGDTGGAVKEAQICLNQRPQMTEARSLIDRFTRN